MPDWTASRRIIAAATSCLATLASGCFWQQQDYTSKMATTMRTYGDAQKIESQLGPAFSESEFAISFRPPRMCQQVQAPQGFLAAFEGRNIQTDPPYEVLVFGSAGGESLADFQNAGLSALAAAGRAPTVALSPVAPTEAQTMHGQTFKFDTFSAKDTRNAVSYFWFVYVTEETPQKVMIVFSMPESIFTTVGEGIPVSLSSLALASKYTAAAGRR